MAVSRGLGSFIGNTSRLAGCIEDTNIDLCVLERHQTCNCSRTCAIPSRSGMGELSSTSKLIFGAGGIYFVFIYYGTLQEDVYRYVAPDGSSFHHAWFLMIIESLSNGLLAFVGMTIAGPTKALRLQYFAISGASQVSAKAFTNIALVKGLSYPVAILAKSAKMLPVMAGSVILGGSKYSKRDYLQSLAIVAGTIIVSMGMKQKASAVAASSAAGLVCIGISLLLDGVTAGFQKLLKTDAGQNQPKTYEFMFWTNLFMGITAILVAFVTGEITAGASFCIEHPEIFQKILKFSVCSAVGQSFIFFVLANFDPLVLSTITTTRKIVTVLVSILFKGNALSFQGWSGIALAFFGILSELKAKWDQKVVREL